MLKQSDVEGLRAAQDAVNQIAQAADALSKAMSAGARAGVETEIKVHTFNLDELKEPYRYEIEVECKKIITPTTG